MVLPIILSILSSITAFIPFTDTPARDVGCDHTYARPFGAVLSDSALSRKEGKIIDEHILNGLMLYPQFFAKAKGIDIKNVPNVNICITDMERVVEKYYDPKDRHAIFRCFCR